ncbi:hypothetical protein D3C80_1842940 [compost metagenome]
MVEAPRFNWWLTGPVCSLPLRPPMNVVLSSLCGMNEPPMVAAPVAALVRVGVP